MGAYELTAISYHAYPYVADKYVLMAAGSSIGDGYGPMVVASKPHGAGGTQGQAHRDSGQADNRLPGAASSAARFRSGGQVPFDKILDAVQRTSRADAGLMIHEAQLTYGQERLPHRGGSGALVEKHLRSAAAAGRQRPAPRFDSGDRIANAAG